jgi:opacity protein-like surface antigen
MMMKRLVSLAAVGVVLLNAAVFAQMSISPGITAGLSSFKETVSYSGMTVTSDSRTGLAFGGLLDISVMNILSIEPGIGYSMRGYKMSTTEPSFGTMTFSNNFSYLTIPVHGKLKFPTPLIKPYALAGLNVGLLLAAKAKMEGTGIPTEELDVKDSMNAVDIGLDLGAGVEFSMPQITPFVEFVYYMGLTNFPKDVPSGYSAKNNGFELKGGLKFKM